MTASAWVTATEAASILGISRFQSRDNYLARRTPDALIEEYVYSLDGGHGATRFRAWIARFLIEFGERPSSHNLNNYRWTIGAVSTWMAEIAFHNAVAMVVERDDDHYWTPRFDDRTSIYRDELAVLAYLPLRDVLQSFDPRMSGHEAARLTRHPQITRGWNEAQSRAIAFLTASESVAA